MEISRLKSTFKFGLFLLWSMAVATSTLPVFDGTLQVPSGRAIKVDGTISPGEWDDAGSVNIPIQPDWNVTVLYKHDTEQLYLAFRNTAHGGVRVYPEVLIDPQNLKSSSWVSGQWWLHASNNLCEANGASNAYSCSHTKDGWDANNPPSSDVVEFQIALAKTGLRQNASFGIALAMTDAAGNFKQRWNFWPTVANIRWPSSWGEARLVQEALPPGRGAD